MAEQKMYQLLQASELPFFKKTAILGVNLSYLKLSDSFIQSLLFKEYDRSTNDLKNPHTAFLNNTIFSDPTISLMNKNKILSHDFIPINDFNWQIYSKKMYSIIDDIDQVYSLIDKTYSKIFKVNHFSIFRLNIRKYLKFIEEINNNRSFLIKKIQERANLPSSITTKIIEDMNDRFLRNPDCKIKCHVPDFNIDDVVGYISNGTLLPIGCYSLKINKIHYDINNINTYFFELDKMRLDTTIIKSSNRKIDIGIDVKINIVYDYNIKNYTLCEEIADNETSFFNSKFFIDPVNMDHEFQKIVESL